MSDFDFVSGDTGSKLRVTVRNKITNALVDLTGATVALRWRSNQTDLLVSQAMTILTPATNAQAEYQFLAGELEQGDMAFEVMITDSLGKTLKSLNPLVEAVREAFA